MFVRSLVLTVLGLGLSFGLAGCEGADGWTAVTPVPLGEALLSIEGRSPSDVWAVGADAGRGPIALHYDGSAWTRTSTGTRGALWWVHAFDDGTVYAGGASATVVRWDGTAWSRLETPGLGATTIYGIWGRTPKDAYVVGSRSGRDGFVWHYDGSAFHEVAQPTGLAGDGVDAPGFFKVTGTAKDVWVVGAHGNVLRSASGAAFTSLPQNAATTLYTASATDRLVVAVGGADTGTILESENGGALHDVTPTDAPLLQGVFVRSDGQAVASGQGGAIYVRDGHAWNRVDTHLSVAVESLHAVWMDPDGGVWAVGGNVLSPSLDAGVIFHRGVSVAPYVVASSDAGMPAAVCPDAMIDPHPDRSIARRWDEQLLGAIRRDVPRPTVHARNLFHASAAMWDAWATYDTTTDGVFFHERHTAADVVAARAEALSYAAYRILDHRYASQVGGAVSVACFQAFMARVGYDPAQTSTDGDSPSAVGNRIAATIIAATVSDGCNEAANYADATGWTSSNPPLVVDRAGTVMNDPNHFQPLNLALAQTQNGLIVAAGVQKYIGSNWNDVTPFALHRAAPSVAYYDAGPAPTFTQPEMKTWVLDVLARQAELDTTNGKTIDTSPGALGNNTLGTNDGHGRVANPKTGIPYAPQVVPLGDFGRVMAEFWADGPNSETPPGHWNVLANGVTDSAGFSRQVAGTGPSLDALEWDVKLYLALNGAVHDAAIEAWGEKRISTTARPISLVRYMAGLGQSSDSTLPRYDANGLPLVPGLVEVITAESAAPGQRHEALQHYIGELAVRAWRGEPGNRATQVAGVTWIRALDWAPYQRRTFVTPAFPGFTSGHSTFSRAAAEVLTAMTGSSYFPGGLGEHLSQPGSLSFETGPSTPVRLQWATYYDAADQAGQSRLWGGIHLAPDDLVGRRTGSQVGVNAVALALTYFDGTAQP